jgi:ribosomal protein L7Ae-like RNA K-turn-binding protein
MTSDSLLQLLGLAYRGRHLESGEQPVSLALRDKKARIVLAACDSAENTKSRLRNWTAENSVPLFELDCTKEELGAALGKASCSMAAITDAGLALAALKQLDPNGEHAETVKKLEGIKKRKMLKASDRRKH